MGYGTAGRHPADVTRFHQLIRAKAVLVLDFSFEQVGQSRQANMRMLTDVHAFACRIAGFEHVVEKHEGPDAAALGRRQRAQDRLSFDILGARVDHGRCGHGVFQAQRVIRQSITR